MADTSQVLARTCESDELTALLDQRYEVERNWLSEQLEERARYLQLLVEQEVAKCAEAKFHRLHESARQDRNADLMPLRRSLNELTSRVDGLGLQELRTELHDEINGLQEQMKAIMLGFGETPDLSPQRMGRLSELLLSDPKQDSINEIRREIESVSASMSEFRTHASHRLEVLESELKGREADNHGNVMTYIHAIEAQMKLSAHAINRVSDVLAASHGCPSDGSKDGVQAMTRIEVPSLYTRLTSAESTIESLVQQLASITHSEPKAEDTRTRVSVGSVGPAFATIDLGCLQSDFSVQAPSASARSQARSPVQSARTTPRCVVRMQRSSVPTRAYQIETASSTAVYAQDPFTDRQASTATRPLAGNALGRESRSIGTSPRIGTQASSMLVPAFLSNSNNSGVATVSSKPATPLLGSRPSRGSQQVSPHLASTSASPPPLTRSARDCPYSQGSSLG